MLREPGSPGRHITESPFLHLYKIISVPNGGKFCPRGLMSLSLGLRVTVFFLPQLMPSVHDLKEDHKLVGKSHCSVLGNQAQDPRAVRSQVASR